MGRRINRRKALLEIRLCPEFCVGGGVSFCVGFVGHEYRQQPGDEHATFATYFRMTSTVRNTPSPKSALSRNVPVVFGLVLQFST